MALSYNTKRKGNNMLTEYVIGGIYVDHETGLWAWYFYPGPDEYVALAFPPRRVTRGEMQRELTGARESGMTVATTNDGDDGTVITTALQPQWNRDSVLADFDEVCGSLLLSYLMDETIRKMEARGE